MTHNRTYLKDIKGIELLFIVQMYPFKKFKFLSAKDHKKVAYQSLSLIHSQRLSLSPTPTCPLSTWGKSCTQEQVKWWMKIELAKVCRSTERERGRDLKKVNERKEEMKARISQIVKQVWLLSSINCLHYLFWHFITATAYHLRRYEPSFPSTT